MYNRSGTIHPMSYAVIQAQGKQYKVVPGQILEIDRMKGEKGDSLQFSEVLLHVEEGKVKIGSPFISNTTVSAKIVDHVRGEKVRVGKFKAKARYRRTTGFRSDLTKIQIETIKAK